MSKVHELDVVQVTADQANGVVAGARGVAVAVYSGGCTVEFTDGDGYTIGLFEIPEDDLRVVDYLRPAGLARED